MSDGLVTPDILEGSQSNEINPEYKRGFSNFVEQLKHSPPAELAQKFDILGRLQLMALDPNMQNTMMKVINGGLLAGVMFGMFGDLSSTAVLNATAIASEGRFDIKSANIPESLKIGTELLENILGIPAIGFITKAIDIAPDMGPKIKGVLEARRHRLREEDLDYQFHKSEINQAIAAFA